MTDKNSIIEDMKKLGFSEYECKAYLSLLESYPLNGYSLSKNSGIPRSRIYEVLKSLKDKNMVQEEIVEKNTVYYPTEPSAFIEQSRTSFSQRLENIGKFAEEIYRKETRDDKLIVIKGRENVITFLKDLINKSEKRIAVSMWEEELSELYPELDEAVKRGVILRGIYFGDRNRYESLVPHRRIQRYMAEKKERYMAVIIDSMDVISGIVSRDEDSKVTWTQDEGFIEVTEDYIAHDLIVNLMSASLEGDEKHKFEDFADSISKEYFNYSDEEFNNIRKY